MKKLLNKILSFISVFLLLFYQTAIPLVAFAEEATPSVSQEQVVEPTPEPSPSPSETPAPSIESSPTPTLGESLITPPATQSALIDTSTTENQSSASLAPPLWQTNSDGSATTTNNVVLNQIYTAPQNSKATVTFSKLPDPAGTITIKEVKLTPEEQVSLGALSDTAYDITSTMENGTFEYTLTLPTPKTEGVEVKASEDGETFVTLGGVTAQEDTLTITGLNHFTIFLISADTNSATGTGAYTATTGPTLVESAVGQVTTADLVLNAPIGFNFKITASSVIATVTTNGSCADLGANKPIKLGTTGGGSSVEAVTPTTTQITTHVKAASKGTSGCASTITWSGIEVRPTAGTPLASGDITLTGTIGGATFNPNTFTEVAGAVNNGTSTVGASPASVPADGSTTSTVTVTLKDQFNNPVSGKSVTLSSSRGATDTISAASGPSDSSGIVTFTVKSSTEGTATFTAVGDSITITQTATVTFTATTGSITIIKDSIPDSGVNFNFSGDLGDFSLDDDTDDTLLNQITFSNLTPGSYDVVESDFSDWDLTDLSCNESTVNSSPDIDTQTASITLDAGEDVICTFENTRRARIRVDKVTDPSADPQSFNFNLTGGVSEILSESFSLTDESEIFSTGFSLEPGEGYSISEDLPEGWELTSASCSDDSPIDNISLSPGESVTCTFTNTKLGSISGYKFHDWDGDGVWDEEDEDPIEDWTIFLYQDGELINETTTDWWEWGDWGLYSFENLLPGTYLVCENLEDDTWTQTTPWDNSLCPNGDGYEINLSAGETATEDDNGTLLYFGNFQYGRISGYKFEDINGDGVWEENEFGLPDWTIFLDTNDNGELDDGEPFATTYSDDNEWGYGPGYFEFTNLRPGTYQVREVAQEGWAQTTDNRDITITSNADEVVDFGNFKKVLITGLKWKDLNANGQLDEGEPGIEGWNIDVSTVSATSLIPDGGGEPIPTEIVQLQLTSQTDSSGQFSAVVDRPGTYRITEQAQDNFQNTWPVDSFFDVFVEVSGQTTEGEDSITQDHEGNPLRFGNAPIIQIQGATFVPTSGDSSSSTEVLVLGSSTISVSDNGGTSSVELQSGTVITREDGEPINISELTADDVTESSLTGLASGVVVDGALQWGLNNVELNFNPAITLNIFVGTALNGQTLNIQRSTSGSGGWTNEGIGPPTTCVVANGLCTFTATKASFYATTHTLASTPTPTPTSTSSTSGGGGNDGGDGLGCAVNDCSIHPISQPLVLGISTIAGLTPAVLGISTENPGNVGIGEETGQVQGEATASAQEVSSPTPAPQSVQGQSPFNFKAIAIIVILLLGGFAIFRFLVK